ncbi:conserved hypothetical protein [Leptospira interrogans serovar Manilae]|uniref:Uncharacterized protein n=1 Tax=Leptospira interrogans serovar Manilae TaxID=214675 RepID=A0AAQ1NZH8_LEPIR|nr:conserved hypothetical protein [Leptospira interrogans serovar Manilae]
MGTTTKFRFVCKMLWELSQIKILQTNSKIVELILLEKSFSTELMLKWDLNFDDSSKTKVLCKNWIGQ